MWVAGPVHLTGGSSQYFSVMGGSEIATDVRVTVRLDEDVDICDESPPMNSKSSVTRSSRAAAAAVAAAVAEAAAVPRGKAFGLPEKKHSEHLRLSLAGRAVDPQEPREQLGLYWGFQTRPRRSAGHAGLHWSNESTRDDSSKSLLRGWPAA